jgi:hypothetical protein
MEAINMLKQKFAKACMAMEPIVKDQTADVKTYTYSYADLTSVLRVVKSALAAQNLTLAQPIMIQDDHLIVTTLITDIDTGESLSFSGPGCPIKGDPQAAGSAISYFRRYALLSLFALEQEDDDGAQATRAARDPHNRTPAETEIRAIIAALPKEDQSLFIADFKEQFGMSLTDLGESRHGDALGFAKFWTKPEPEIPATTKEWATDEANLVGTD